MKTLFQFLHLDRKISVLLFVFVCLALFYSISIPLFEGPDEDAHFRFAKYIADQRALPVQAFAPGGGDAGHQGWQPPLYYALAALVIAPLDTSDYSEHLYRNDAATFVGDPSCCGRNIYYHFANENFPYTRTTLAVHLARLLSIFFGAITVAATYALAKTILNRAREFRIWNLEFGIPLAAASIVAFNPSFLFASALVSNDAPLAAFSSLVLLAWVKLLRGHIALDVKSAAMLGALISLGVLTKTTALALVPLTLLLSASIIFQRHRGNARGWLRDATIHSLLFVFCFLLFSGWWFARNWILYGDPLAARLVQISALFPRAGPLTLAELFQINLPWLWQTFWGGPTPGDFPTGILILLFTLTGLALLGLLQTFSRIANLEFRISILFLAAWLFVIFAAQIQFVRLTVGADQGRYLFPAIAAFALFFVVGLQEIADWGLRASRAAGMRIAKRKLRISNFEFRISVLLPPAFFALALFVPLAYVNPAYARPALLSESDLARVSNPLRVHFAEQIELRGADIGARAVKAGETLDVTLTWRARARMPASYRVFVHLIAPDDARAGGADVIPARGAFPTLYWNPGDALRDVVRVPVDAAARAGKYFVQVGLYPVGKGNQRLEIADSGGESRAIIGAIKIAPRDSPAYAPATRVAANFADLIELVGYDFTREPNAVRLALYWRARAAMEREYTVFIHVLDANGKIVAQMDRLPQNGIYPTSIWDAGEIVRDDYRLTLPTNPRGADYRIALGLYRADTGARLPILGTSRDEFIFESSQP